MVTSRIDYRPSDFSDLTKESVWWPLYDFHRIEKLGEAHHFFQIPIGGVGMEPKTEADTNMYLAGCLPHGNAFLASGIRVVFIPDCDAHRGRFHKDIQDTKRTLLAGTLRFDVGNRMYSQGSPLARFPACFPLFSNMDRNFFQRCLRKLSLFRVQKHSYYEIVPVYIQENQYFRVSVYFDPRHQIALNAPGKLGVILDGRLVRASSY